MNKKLYKFVNAMLICIIASSCTSKIDIKTNVQNGVTTFSFWKDTWLRGYHRIHLNCVQLITVFDSRGELLWRIDRGSSERCFEADAVSYGANVQGYDYYFSGRKLTKSFVINVLSSNGSGTARF